MGKSVATNIANVDTIEKWVIGYESDNGFSAPTHISIWVSVWCPLIGCSKYGVYWVRNNQVMMNREFILDDKVIVYHSSEIVVG